MVSDLYVFDLETFYWERIPAAPDDDVPRARYFHSADTCTYPLSRSLPTHHMTRLQGATISSSSAA